MKGFKHKMNNELVENLKEYFNNYEESVRMLESGNKARSTYPSYKFFIKYWRL